MFQKCSNFTGKKRQKKIAREVFPSDSGDLKNRLSRSLTELQFPPIEVIDTIEFNYIPLFKDKFFLHQKYVVERLSTQEIADQIFSAKSTVLKYLKHHRIPLREVGVTIRRRNWLAYGQRILKRHEAVHHREQDNIGRMQELRSQGFTFDEIAQVFNSMKVPTKTHKGQWHGKTINGILRRQASLSL
jgi:hypothetical protein